MADVVWVIAVFSALVYGLLLFLGENKATPRFWARYYVIVTIFGSALYALHAYRTARWQRESVAIILSQTRWPQVLSVVVLPSVWAVYWMRSKRVRNTYQA